MKLIEYNFIMKTKYQRILDIQFQSKDVHRKHYNKGPLYQLKVHNYQPSRSFQNNRKQRWTQSNVFKDTGNIKQQIIQEAKMRKKQDQGKHLQRVRQEQVPLVKKTNKQNVGIFKVESLKDAGQTIRNKYSRPISSKSINYLHSRKLYDENKKESHQRISYLKDNRILNIDALNQKIHRILQEKSKNSPSGKTQKQGVFQQDSLQIIRYTQPHKQPQQICNFGNRRSKSHQRLQLNTYKQRKSANENDYQLSYQNHFNMTFQKREKLIQDQNLNDKQNDSQEIVTPKTFIQYSDMENQLSLNGYSNRLSQVANSSNRIKNSLKQEIRKYDFNVDQWQKYDKQIQEMESKMREFEIWKKKNHFYQQQPERTTQFNQKIYQNPVKEKLQKSHQPKQRRNHRTQETAKKIHTRYQYQQQQMSLNNQIELKTRNECQDTPRMVAKQLSIKQTQFRLQFDQGIRVQVKQNHKSRLLKSLEHQIKLDRQFVGQKLWFNESVQHNKWDVLFTILSQRDQQIPFMEKSQIIQTFSIQRSQASYFKAIPQQSSISQLVQTFIRTQRYWSSKILHRFSRQQLQNSQIAKIFIHGNGSLIPPKQFVDMFQNQHYQVQDLQLIFKRFKAIKGVYIMSERILQMLHV